MRLLHTLVLSAALAASGNPQSRICTPVSQFIERTYIHGLPVEQAIALRKESCALPALRDRLYAPDDQYRVNTILTLGILGEVRTVDDLAQFLEEGAGDVSHSEYLAKTNVPIALGYLANQTTGATQEAALAYLIAGLDEQRWHTRIRWTSRFDETAAKRDKYLTRKAMQGLGLSGTSVAREALLAYRTDDQGLRKVIEESLRANATIAERGLAGYYH